MSLQLNTKSSFNILRTEIEAAVLAVANKHGLNMRTGSIKYEGHGGECTIQLKVTTKDKPQAATHEAVSMLEMYGLKGYYDKQVRTHDGQVFVVKGINSRCRKSPVILERPNGGRGAKCPVSYVLNRCTIINDTTPTTTPTPTPTKHIDGTARDMAGGRMWTINHEGCTAPLAKQLNGGRRPRVGAVVKCGCGKHIHITESLSFEDQM